MVAGDTKRIVVIKNISSNLIEEAILILKSGPGAKDEGQSENPPKTGIRNELILKEAENIINQYIKENGLVRNRTKHRPSKRFPFFRLSLNTGINIFLIAAVTFLIIVVCKLL